MLGEVWILLHEISCQNDEQFRSLPSIQHTCFARIIIPHSESVREVCTTSAHLIHPPVQLLLRARTVEEDQLFDVNAHEISQYLSFRLQK